MHTLKKKIYNSTIGEEDLLVLLCHLHLLRASSAQILFAVTFVCELCRHLDTICLPDTSVGGISLMEGKLVGLSNMARVEMAVIDERLGDCFRTGLKIVI